MIRTKRKGLALGLAALMTAMMLGGCQGNGESGGKVKGNLQIARSASFLPKAVLAGNVSAGMISICQGAQIQGAMRIAEDPETNSLFGDGLEI